MKTYQFWSKKEGSKEVWTELKANSIQEVREWAIKEGIEITSSITKK